MRLTQLFTLSLALVLSACGFHLRGTGSTELSLHELNLIARDSLSPLAKDVRDRLLAQNIELTDTAEYSLYLGLEEHSQRTVSFTAGTRNFERMLTSTLEYEIRSGKLPALVRGEAEVQRAQSFNENHVSASAEESRLLRDEMRTELVQQLMLRLQALKPEQLATLRDQAQARSETDAAAREAEQQRLLQEQKLFPAN